MPHSLAHRQLLADRLAPVMFALSLTFLVLLAALIVIWVDIPRVAELAALEALDVQGEQEAADDIAREEINAVLQHSTAPYRATGRVVLWLLILVWLVFPLEWLVSRRYGLRDTEPEKNRWHTGLQYCLVPPLRLSAPSAVYDNRIWLPWLSWRSPGRDLSRQLARSFSTPMLVIALLILPILVIEYGLSGWVDRYHWLRMMLHISTGFIWFAFTVEFIILIGATDKKLAYVRKNWIDLAIILLPLISFLRSIRALRLARLARVQRLAKVGRVYRMRGLMMKAVRALMLLEVVNRILRITPEKKLARLREHHAEKAMELAELEEEMAVIRSRLEDAAKAETAVPPTNEDLVKHDRQDSV